MRGREEYWAGACPRCWAWALCPFQKFEEKPQDQDFENDHEDWFETKTHLSLRFWFPENKSIPTALLIKNFGSPCGLAHVGGYRH
jgi:hypothetical protein